MENKNKYYSPGYACGVPLLPPVDFRNKAEIARTYNLYMLARTQRMFKYNGLPKEISQRNIEVITQTTGAGFWFTLDGKLYYSYYNPGGNPDFYYMPTVNLVANPDLMKTYQFKINGVEMAQGQISNVLDGEGAVMPNDSLYMGLYKMFNMHATKLAEIDITMRKMIVNSRNTAIISAPDTRTKKSAELYQEKMEAGDDAIILETQLFDGIKAQPLVGLGSNGMTQLIEAKQYELASMFNFVDLNANYNMKREYINESESQLDEPGGIPLIADMLYNRRLALDVVNSWGYNISVELDSAWKVREKEIEAEVKNLSEEPKTNEEPTEDEEAEANKDEKTI